MTMKWLAPTVCIASWGAILIWIGWHVYAGRF